MMVQRWIMAAVVVSALGGCGAVTGLTSPSASTSGAGTVADGNGGATTTTSSGTTTTTGTGGTGGVCSSVSGLLAYYPLDGDTLDHSGNGNDALGAKLTPAAGKIGGAYWFDGNGSSLRATGAAMLDGARTFCAWVCPDPRSGLGQAVFSGGQADEGDFFSISASSPSGGTCTFLSPDVPFVDHWGTPCYTAEAPALSPGSWHFVCYAYDGTDALNLYADGTSMPTLGSAYAYGLDTLYMGSTAIGGTTTQPSLLGTLDEVTVWTRALDADDLAALWNGGAGCAAL